MKKMMVSWFACALLLATTGGTIFSKSAEVRLRAQLAGPTLAGDVSGKAEFRNRLERGRRQFSVQVEGFNPGERYDVMVAGQIVGTVEINGFGIGELHYDTNFEPGLDDPDTKFPPNFPNLDGGELVVVGPLSGTFQ